MVDESIHCFDFVNVKSQITQERTISKDRKRRRNQESQKRWQDGRKVQRN
jgi:hypothetical protein